MKRKHQIKWIAFSVVVLFFAKFLREEGLVWLNRNIYKFTKSTEKVLTLVEQGATIALILLLILTATTIYLESKKSRRNSK